jgi:hypothetical protein
VVEFIKVFFQNAQYRFLEKKKKLKRNFNKTSPVSLRRKTYVDITGEPDFMERMAHKYRTRAEETGALVVSACGFDSIPADLGAEHCVAQFGQRSLVRPLQHGLVHVQGGCFVRWGGLRDHKQYRTRGKE